MSDAGAELMPNCSAVIISHASEPILFAAVKRVLAQASLAELLVVDQGHAPHTLSRLQQMALTEPRLRILPGKRGEGIAGACNRAALGASGDYLLFLHPDCLIPPQAITDSMAALEADPEAMVAGAWLLNADGSEQITAQARWVQPRTALRHMLRFGRGYPPARFVPGSAFAVAAVPGAYLCIRRADFAALGGFDGDFSFCCEDVELCRRVQNAGKKILLLPQVPVVRVMHSRREALAPAALWQHCAGLMRYYRKHERSTLFPGARAGLNALLLLHHALRCVMDRWAARRTERDGQRSLRARLTEYLAMGEVDLTTGAALQGRQVLVTGASGQIGVCVLRRLVASGASVVALTRQAPLPFSHARVWWVQGDLADVPCALPDIRLDAVVHCAPLWHLPPHLARLAGMGVTRVVAFGSTSLFSKASSRHWHEKELVDALRAAEQAVAHLSAQALMRWTILRPTLVYGMGMDRGIARITRFIRRFGFFPVYPPALGKRHPVHAEDLAEAALLALDHPASYDRAYNLSGADIMTFRGMLERIFKSLGRRPRVVETTFLPFGLDAAGRVLHKKEINAEIAYRMNDDLIFFHDSAAQDFGFSPRGFLREP